MHTKEDILTQLQSIMVDEFELEAAQITPEAHLYIDLELDSIDAVDLVVKLQEITGKKIQPEIFKAVRTVEDVVVAVHELIQQD